MLFTGDDVVQYARDRSTRGKDATLDPWMIARQLNDLLRSLVRKVVREDIERLAEEIVVSNTDVIASTTAVDMTSSSTREWLAILGMDWRASSSGEYEDEVVIAPIEARHRIETEYGHLSLPTGYFFDRMRQFKKVSGWSGVYDLRVYGVLNPEKWDAQGDTAFNLVQDYPEPMFRALQTGFLLRVATHLKPSELEYGLWEREHQSAMDDVMADAEEFVENRIEDIPHQAFER